MDAKGYVVYEVKFRKNPLTEKMINEEIDQVKETGLDCYKFVFISRSSFDFTPKEDIELISLHMLFEE